jgi:signal peptidase II
MIHKRAVLIAVAVLVLGFDQFGKTRVTRTLSEGERVPLLGEVLSLAHVESSGAALGLFRGWSAESQSMVFGFLSLVCATMVLSFYRGLARGEHGSAAALGAILAGVLSNAFDRFRFGAGIDFLHLGAPDDAWLPDFNLADLAIVLGVVTLVIELLATEMATRAQERPRS